MGKGHQIMGKGHQIMGKGHQIIRISGPGFGFWTLIIFICGFSTKVTGALLASETMKKLKEINTFLKITLDSLLIKEGLWIDHPPGYLEVHIKYQPIIQGVWYSREDTTDAARPTIYMLCRRVLHLNMKYLSDVQLPRVQ